MSIVTEMPTDEGFQVEYHEQTGAIICRLVESACWFPEHEMDRYAPGQHPFLSFDGEHVKLTADNGTWIWKLTGRKYIHHYGPGTTPLILREGLWPD